MPNGTSLVLAGGSWSQALAVLPSESVRLFSPPRVLAQIHIRFGIDRQFQGRRIVLGLLMHRVYIGKNRVGVLRLFERLAFLNALQPVVHAVQDVAHRALAGEVLHAVVLLFLQCGEDFGGR